MLVGHLVAVALMLRTPKLQYRVNAPVNSHVVFTVLIELRRFSETMEFPDDARRAPERLSCTLRQKWVLQRVQRARGSYEIRREYARASACPS